MSMYDRLIFLVYLGVVTGLRIVDPLQPLISQTRSLSPLMSEPVNFVTTQHSFTRAEIAGTPVCGEVIPESANSTWAYTARDGSVVTYTCNVGYETSTGRTQFNFTCNKGSPIQESKLPDSCSIVLCPKPANMANAELLWKAGQSVQYGKFGDVVDYVCDKGFTGDGKAHGPKTVKRICTEKGQFEFVLETITSCQRIHCDIPLMFKNAALDKSVDRNRRLLYNESATYNCETGFTSSLNRTEAQLTVTCSESGEFVPNDPLPRCAAEACPSPPVIPNAATVHVSGIVPIGSRVIYRCADGFVVSQIPASSTFNIMCDMLGGIPRYVLPPADKQCKPAACLALPSLTNAHVADGRFKWAYKDTAHFECDTGYSLGSVKGETTFDGYCNTQGVWTLEDNPKCAPVTCAANAKEIPEELIDYGRMRPFSSRPIQFGMNTTVICMGGAVVTGTNEKETSFELECGPDGDLISKGVCAVPCPRLPKVGNSRSAHFGKVIEYGQPAARITCKPGFLTKSGESVQDIICRRDGTYSPIKACGANMGYVDDDESPFEYESQRHILQDAEYVRSTGVVAATASLIMALLSVLVLA